MLRFSIARTSKTAARTVVGLTHFFVVDILFFFKHYRIQGLVVRTLIMSKACSRHYFGMADRASL
jgi:hypothetical protein